MLPVGNKAIPKLYLEVKKKKNSSCNSFLFTKNLSNFYVIVGYLCHIQADLKLEKMRIFIHKRGYYRAIKAIQYFRYFNNIKMS